MSKYRIITFPVSPTVLLVYTGGFYMSPLLKSTDIFKVTGVPPGY